MTGVVHHGGISDGKRGDVGDGVEIGGAVGIAHPEPLLPGNFETGVVPGTFGTQGIDALEAEALAVNGKAIVVR